MIRINLIGEARRPAAVTPSSLTGLTEASKNLAVWLLVALVAIGLVLATGHYFLLKGQVADKKEQVKQAQKEVDALAPVIKEVEEFKAKKAELERKVNIINDLQANQRGPVRLMDEVSKALPQLLWLDSMDVGAKSIKISGQAFNTNAVANFIENLDKVPEFQEPVLRDTQRRGSVYNFVVNFAYSYAPPPAAAADGTGASTAK